MGSSSGFEQVGSDNSLTVPQENDLPMEKSGYVYIWVSNETTNVEVFFDNLQVIHTRGAILEETHYYPFGLTMAGISSKAAEFGKPENKKNKFQNQEFTDDFGVNGYEFKYRMHDPQIGRFWQIDPLANEYVHNSTYAFSENKVTSHVELEGLEAKLAIGGQGNGTNYTNADRAAFRDRASRLAKVAGYTPKIVSTGDQLLQEMKNATAN
ncbi:MAG TPA: RHS repeat-associated core domain-containing protein [Flavisolibacter sp.]|nr:RHS repeat-associated core domain-containing protein [Flavisolibacter sp.]